MAQQVFSIGEGMRISNAAAVSLGDPNLLGFLCDASTSGTLTITDRAGVRTLVSALPLTAGSFYPLNVRCVGTTQITIGGTGSGLLTYGQ